MIQSIEAVNISIGANMYGRFEDLTNTPSNVLAEFVDNALQSYRDNKEELHSLNSDYRFTVSIEFIRDAAGKEIQEIRVLVASVCSVTKRLSCQPRPQKTTWVSMSLAWGSRRRLAGWEKYGR